MDGLLLGDPGHLPHVHLVQYMILFTQAGQLPPHLLPKGVQQLVRLLRDREVLARDCRLPWQCWRGSERASEPMVGGDPSVGVSSSERIWSCVNWAELGSSGGLGPQGGGDELLLLLMLLMLMLLVKLSAS